jgi:hypothetical protein
MNTPPGLIPLRFRIGVTGHRWNGCEPPGTVAEDVRAAVDRILELFADDANTSTPATTTVVSALAEGADRLVARDVLERSGSRLEVVLPFEASEYVDDFADAASRADFADFLGRASMTTVVRPRSTRDLTYREAGVRIAERCDVIVAVWDGKPGGVGGTSDIVSVVRERGLPMLWVDASAGGFVEEVGGITRPLTSADVCPLEARAAVLLDRYNRERVLDSNVSLIAEAPDGAQDTDDSTAVGDARVRRVLDWAQPYFVRAENVARSWQRYYDTTELLLYLCASLAVFVVAAQVAFFPEHNKIVIAEAALLAFAIVVLWEVRRHRLHDRWIGARHLAEWIRASFFICATGLRARVSNTDGDEDGDPESAWLRRALLEIAAEQPDAFFTDDDAPKLRKLLSDFWVEDQRKYFERAAERNEHREATLRRLTGGLLACSLVFALLHAFSIGGEHLEQVWVFGSITFPVAGAAVHAIATSRDYRKHARRYDAMARAMAEARSAIDGAHRLRGVRTAAANVERMVTREAEDWFGDVRLKDPELPF